MSQIKDGGHIYPTCSNCRAKLADIFITRPDEPEQWRIKVKCCWCGDSSFFVDVKGGFHIGGYGIIKEEDPNDDIPSTTVHCTKTDGHECHFQSVKARKDAKPCY